MAIQKKRKVLRTPFVVTVAAAASFAGAVALPGCDPTVHDGSCPAERPEEGSSCDADDVSCTYSGTCGDDTFRFTCVDGAWQMGIDPTCNPPPPACPDERPEAGSSCAAGGLSCSYLDDCDNPIDYTCTGGAWQMGPEMSCNPPPPPECPETFPETGSACWQIGASCAYGNPPDCPDPTIVTCGEDGTWSVTVAVSCNPPPPACPEATPEDGAPCAGGIGTCGYTMPTGCGPMPIDAECVLEGDTWRWQVHEIFCNPPPPEHCLTAATGEECAGLGPTCQWLVPGCADGDGAPALPAVGCFPSLPCETDDACPAGTLCQEVVVNPCGSASGDGATCAACGLYKNVCVPPSAATAAGK
ncbi:hypothetical protein [Sorangium sp. So ce861]|uniref:hypothetical protein n=1 Tax=Sorangium sp. So ce861 TaxID=3133323 RepID=UPI003F6384A3